MTIGHHFKPDAARARALNARMHAELAASLRHVCDESRGVLSFDEAAMGTMLRNLEGGANYPAGIFSRYYELVDAILEDRPAEAERLYADLCQARPLGSGLDVKVLGAPELGVDSERYQQMMNSDPSVDLGFTAPPADVAEAFRGRLAQGLDLLQRGLPELSGEFRAIVREIIICGSDPTKKLQFDGGSHYQLWGALFLNGQFHPDPLAVVEVLAHESAHSLLFGFCTHLPLVENDDEERFASPLRTDLRPMDGIYHATYVSARMHWAMTSLAQSGLLVAEDADKALAAAKADLANFDFGYAVVAEHGRLTHLGDALMREAKAYMDAQR
jgi:hypothetical protein